MVNSEGWSELIDGNMVKAAYTMFDGALGSQGWTLTFLLLTTMLMIYRKSGNSMLVFILGSIFSSLFWASGYVHEGAKVVIVVVLTFCLAGVLYKIFRKNNG